MPNLLLLRRRATASDLLLVYGLVLVTNLAISGINYSPEIKGTPVRFSAWFEVAKSTCSSDL